MKKTAKKIRLVTLDKTALREILGGQTPAPSAAVPYNGNR